MKIFENISSGYKRIATGIAIIGFLSMMYLALIPGASVAYVYGASGEAISGALVFIKEWPQYNATTDGSGAYMMPNVPIGTYNLSASAPGYATNTNPVTVVEEGTVQDFSLHLNAKMVGFSWITSYNATGAATSTMGLQLPRPTDLGTEFYGQFDSRKTTAGYLTLILVSDFYGTGANLDVNVLYSNGTLYNTSSQVVPVNGTLAIRPDLTGLLQGTVTIKSNLPVLAEKRTIYYTPGTSNVEGSMSMLLPPKGAATTEFFGQYDSRRETAGYLTVIVASDVLGTGANLSIEYMYSNGTHYNTTSGVIPINGTMSIRPDLSGLLQGKVQISSDQPVVIEKRIILYKLGTSLVKAMMGDSMSIKNDSTKELIVPKYDSRRSTLGWLSLIILTDIYGTGANVNVDYFYLNGTLHNTSNIQVPVNGSYTILPANTGVLEGRMNIHSDNPIVGEERIVSYQIGTSNVENIMSFNLLKENDAVLDPVIPQYDSRGQWDAEIVISSINESSTPDIIFYTSTGNYNHTESYDIMANGSYDLYPGDLSKGRLEVGTVRIKGSP